MFTNLSLSVIWQKLLRKIPRYNSTRYAVVSMTNAEYLSLIGLSYWFNVPFTLPLAASDYWFKFTAPADRDVQILLRELMPALAGVKYELYEGTDGYTSNGDAVTCHRNNPLAGVAPLAIVQPITTPTTFGDLIDTPIYIGEGGANNANARSGGTLSTGSGLRTYGATTGFFARIVNKAGGLNSGIYRCDYAEINELLLRS